MKRNIYLNSKTTEEVIEILDGILLKYPYDEIETVSVYNSIDRISAEEQIARISSPFYNASAMDGIVVKSKDTYEASERNLVEITDYKEVNTGNPIEDGYDAVIMIEDCIYKNDKLFIKEPARTFQHIRPVGEDIVEGEMIIPRNKKITPIELQAMIAGGIVEVSVYKKPNVLIIPTGNEIIKDAKEIAKGKILDTNSHFVKYSIEKLGANANIKEVSCDDYDKLKNEVLNCTKESDLVIVGAGSSAGSKDFTKAVIEDLGEVLFHGISIKPGKPTIVGIVNNKIVIGLPGYPVSTYIAFDIVVKKIINHFLKQDTNISLVKAILSKKIYSSLKNEEYVRVKLGYVNDTLICTPLTRGAGITMSLVKADGLLVIPREVEGYDRLTSHDIRLLSSLDEVKRTIVSIGSHDLIMDYIDDLLSENHYRLSSSHIGSFGGVLAIKNGECHLAPVHILENGVYNDFLIEKYDLNAYLYKGVERIQGIAVKKGNPLNIKGIKDLVNVKFANRQRGAGTRILLDYLLKEEGVNSSSIDGYDYELSTHMTVATAVSEGQVDAGLCIKSVAEMKGLDFIEVASERYDFLVDKGFAESDIFNKFINTIQSDDFKKKVEEIGGYVINDIGLRVI